MPADRSATIQTRLLEVAAYAAVAAPRRHLFGFARRPRVSTIAVVAPSYGMERVSYLIPSQHHQYITLGQLSLKVLDRRGTFYQQTPIILGPPVDLVHTFNQIPLNRNFVVTAEMELPRYLGEPRSWQVRAGLELLSSARCRGIWALSEAARAYIARRFTLAGYQNLGGKITVFRGAVSSAPSPDTRTGPDRHRLKLLFVGGDGLRKGLRPTVDAADRLRRAGVDVSLTVVGKPGSSTYVVPGAQFATHDLEEILSSRKWITHYRSATNRDVRELMATHDVFALPTMDESLGWVIAEAGISGMPVVTTNIFAIPEMVVDQRTGWTIGLPLGEDLRWSHIGRSDAHDAWVAAQEHITAMLVEILGHAAADPELVSRLGAQARRHVSDLYGLDAAGRRLNDLYDRAIRRA